MEDRLNFNFFLFWTIFPIKIIQPNLTVINLKSEFPFYFDYSGGKICGDYVKLRYFKCYVTRSNIIITQKFFFAP